MPVTRKPVSISASIINPSISGLYLTGANAFSTPNINANVPSVNIGILIRDMSHTSPDAPAGLGNMNAEDFFVGIEGVKIESPNYNTNGYVPLGLNLEEIYNPGDIGSNGGITGLVTGQILTDALNQNTQGVIKIYVKYKLQDISPAGNNQVLTEEQPMILYHFADHEAAGFYGEIYGKGSHVDVTGQVVSQNLHISMKHMRTGSSTSTPVTMQTFIEQEGPLGSPTIYTQYDQSSLGQQNSLGEYSSPPAQPANANTLNGQILPFPATVGLGVTAGNIVQAGIPSAAVDVVHNGQAVTNTSYFNQIHLGMQFGVASFSSLKGVGSELMEQEQSGPSVVSGIVNGMAGLSSNGSSGDYMSYTYFRVGAIDTEYIEIYAPGCTDPTACNYDPTATVNDGTCSYTENDYLIENNQPTFDTSIPGQTTVSGFSVELSYGSMTFSPGTYNTNPFDGGNPTINLAVSINGAPEYLAATGTLAASSSTATGATGTFTDSISQIVLNPGDTVHWTWEIVPVNSTCYSPAVSSTLFHVAVDNSIAGCTSSTAYNYNALATVDDGSCAYCTSSTDVIQGFYPLQYTIATNSTTNDAGFDFNLQVGSAFGGSANGTVHILEHADSTTSLPASDITNYLTSSTISSNFTVHSTLPIVGTTSGGVVSVGLTNLPGGKMFDIVVEIDGGYDVNSSCYFNTQFYTQYYDCTDITFPNGSTLDPAVIYTNYAQPVFIGPGLNQLANVTDETICNITTDCTTLNTSVEIYFAGDINGNCTNVYYINWFNVPLVPEVNHVLTLTTPSGDVTPLYANTNGIPIPTSSGSTGITIQSSNNNTIGTYTAELIVTSSDGSLSCNSSDSMTIQEADLTTCGCTDPTANNYNANSTNDDGSCQYHGCTDPNAFNFIGTQYGTQTRDCSGNFITDIFGIGNQLADNSCCIYDIFDCTDPTATNYNSAATQDDGSCIYPVIPGCTDPGASLNSYNPNATIDDGSCLYVGCTDVNSTNPTYYTNNLGIQVLANVSNGTCVYNQDQVPGCTDIGADNYNSDATVDDGSCSYGDVDGQGNGNSTVTLVVPNYNDFLDQLDVCISKALTSYHTKLITGQKCDKDRLLHLTIVKHLLDNRKLNCLFSGTSESLVKLNKFITFALAACDDCEQDLAPSANLIGSEVVVVPTNVDFLQQADGSYIQQSGSNLFIETNQNNII